LIDKRRSSQNLFCEKENLFCYCINFKAGFQQLISSDDAKYWRKLKNKLTKSSSQNVQIRLKKSLFFAVGFDWFEIRFLIFLGGFIRQFLVIAGFLITVFFIDTVLVAGGW
jgi:hypothetical protein